MIDERHELDVVENKSLRSVCGDTRMYRLRIEEVMRRIRENMSERVVLNVSKWLRHVE